MSYLSVSFRTIHNVTSQTDLLQRVIDEAQAKNHDLDVMIQNILAIEFVSIHTTSNVRSVTLTMTRGQESYINLELHPCFVSSSCATAIHRAFT